MSHKNKPCSCGECCYSREICHDRGEGLKRIGEATEGSRFLSCSTMIPVNFSVCLIHLSTICKIYIICKIFSYPLSTHKISLASNMVLLGMLHFEKVEMPRHGNNLFQLMKTEPPCRNTTASIFLSKTFHLRLYFLI